MNDTFQTLEAAQSQRNYVTSEAFTRFWRSNPAIPDDRMGVPELARILGIGESIIYHWARGTRTNRSPVPLHVSGGGMPNSITVSRADVIAWKEARDAGPTTD